MKHQLFILGVLLVAPMVVQSASVSEELPGHGKVNWSQKTITVTGSGAPSLKAANVAVARLGAERAAKLDAFRNILEAVKGLIVNGQQTAASVMNASPSIQSKVEGVIRNFTVVDTKYYSDGGVDLIVSVPLGGVTEAIIPHGDEKSEKEPANSTTKETGVIVNAKGIKVTPALVPRLVDETGQELFGPTFVTQATLSAGDLCRYVKSLRTAKRDGRLGAYPLIVRALRPVKKGSADLVIAADDAAKLVRMAGVLREGRLIIVTD